MSRFESPKKDIRNHARRARQALSADERARSSRKITERFLNSRYFLAARTIACYLATWEEVDTTAIIERAWRAEKRIFAPVTGSRRRMIFCELSPDTPMLRNDFGLWEPQGHAIVAPQDLDVVVTPLVAFDEQRNRIGMGGGYFDCTFAFLKDRRYWLRPKLIGLAFDCQKVEDCAPKPWDIRVSRVFSESS